MRPSFALDRQGRSARAPRTSARFGPPRPRRGESNSLTVGAKGAVLLRRRLPVLVPGDLGDGGGRGRRRRSRSSGFRSSCGRRRSRCSRCEATTSASTGRRTSTRARSRSASRSICLATSRARRSRSPPASGPASKVGCGRSSTCSTRRSSARARTSPPTTSWHARPRRAGLDPDAAVEAAYSAERFARIREIRAEAEACRRRRRAVAADRGRRDALGDGRPEPLSGR